MAHDAYLVRFDVFHAKSLAQRRFPMSEAGGFVEGIVTVARGNGPLGMATYIA
jgi:hypothetical protein